MDEVNSVDDRSCAERIMHRLRGISDDMAGKNRNGTWEALAGPAIIFLAGEEPSP
jgi:hypothetical protein